jgi:hypothetical protein
LPSVRRRNPPPSGVVMSFGYALELSTEIAVVKP